MSFLASAPVVRAQDPEQYLRDQYQGKALILRGFYSANRLRYNDVGSPDNSATGDWTEDGLVLVHDIHFSNDRLTIQTTRLVADFIGGQFELRPERQGKFKTKPAVLKIEADFPQHNPSPEQIEALMSRIFLTSHDHLVDLVPDYWRPCIRGGLTGQQKSCLFSPQISAIPGLAIAEKPAVAGDPSGGSLPGGSKRAVFHIGNGVSPPRTIRATEPEFTESARLSKFGGTVVLGLIVDREGVATNIRILNPLGSGLDAKAVQAVKTWEFKPATKDAEPVAAEIAVEVDFHIY